MAEMKRIIILFLGILMIILSFKVDVNSQILNNMNNVEISKVYQNYYFDYGKKIDDELFNITVKYEEYVRWFENDTYGYEKLLGYPMYLFSFGYMYYDLYNITSSKLFLNKFWRCVNYSIIIKHNDWTWTGYIGYPFKSSLYNFLAYDLYIRAYMLSHNNTYLNYAKNSLLGFTNASYSLTHTYNANIFVGCEIVDYLTRFGNNSLLYNLGRKCFEFSLRGIEGNLWYYSERDMEAKNYYSRSAFYQNIVVSSIMDKSEGIKTLYPQIWNEIGEKLPDMFNITLKYLTPSLTWYYTDDVFEYTEGAGNLIYSLSLFDGLYGFNHTSLVKNLTKFIGKMQCVNGAFWRDGYKKEEIFLWYTDNIGVEIAEYLNNVGYKNNYTPENFNYTQLNQQNIIFLNKTLWNNHTFLYCENMSVENSTVSFYNITSQKFVIINSTVITHSINSSSLQIRNSTIICDFMNWENISIINSTIYCENMEGGEIYVFNSSLYGKFNSEIKGVAKNTKMNNLNFTILDGFNGNFSGEYVMVLNSHINISGEYVIAYNSTLNLKSNCSLNALNSTVYCENIAVELKAKMSELYISNTTIQKDFFYIYNSNVSLINSDVQTWKMYVESSNMVIKNSEINTTELLYIKNSQSNISGSRIKNIWIYKGSAEIDGVEVKGEISIISAKAKIFNLNAGNFGEYLGDFSLINNSTANGKKILLNAFQNNSICIISQNMSITDTNSTFYLNNANVNFSNSTGEIYSYYSTVSLNNSTFNLSLLHSSLYSYASKINGFILQSNDISIKYSFSELWISNSQNVRIANSELILSSWESTNFVVANCKFYNDGFLSIKINNITVTNNDFRGLFALYLLNSSEIQIYNNSFFTEDVFDNRNLYWNSSTRGNYWPSWASQYNDSDGDGIIDTPYPVNGGFAYDYYPLANPPVIEINSIILLLLVVLHFLSVYIFQRSL